MAKKVVATLKKKGANQHLTKVIKMVKSEKNGAYSFQEEIVDADMVKEFFARK